MDGPFVEKINFFQEVRWYIVNLFIVKNFVIY